MRITVTYEISVAHKPNQVSFAIQRAKLLEQLRGPLHTGTEAANAQLAAENKKLRLKLIDAEVEDSWLK